MVFDNLVSPFFARQTLHDCFSCSCSAYLSQPNSLGICIVNQILILKCRSLENQIPNSLLCLDNKFLRAWATVMAFEPSHVVVQRAGGSTPNRLNSAELGLSNKWLSHKGVLCWCYIWTEYLSVATLLHLCFFFLHTFSNKTFLKLNLLGYRFQIYKSMKHHLHTASWAHCPKQSLFPSPFSSLCPPSPILTLLSLRPLTYCCLCVVLYCIVCCWCLWLLYVCCFYLIPSHSFIQSPFPLPSDSCQSVMGIHASVSVLSVSLFCSLESSI